MGVAEWTLVGVTVLTVVVGLISRLLAKKDEAQEQTIRANKEDADKKIADLYAKHQVDADKLTGLELLIAKNYHDKADIKAMLDGFKAYFDEKFNELRSTLKASSHDRE